MLNKITKRCAVHLPFIGKIFIAGNADKITAFYQRIEEGPRCLKGGSIGGDDLLAFKTYFTYANGQPYFECILY